MRISSLKDCEYVFEKFKISREGKKVCDIGGTDTVSLDKKISKNPILEIHPDIFFLDRGYNNETLGGNSHEQVDFLKKDSIQNLKDKFDITYCFDTLEHVSNPFLFCEHLAYITKPGGFIYISTLFSWSYHPSPKDYFRYSPEGLKECFKNEINKMADDIEILWYDWESDSKTGKTVALLARRIEKK